MTGKKRYPDPSISRPPGTRARGHRRTRPDGKLKSKREKAGEDALTVFGADFLMGMLSGFVIATTLSDTDGVTSARRKPGAAQSKKKDKPN